MQSPAILDSSDSQAAIARRRLGGALGSVLQEATTDPGRMLPLWTAFSRGEPVRAPDLRRAVSDGFVAEAVRHELLQRVEVSDDEPWLRGSVCIVAADIAGELLWVASDFPWYDHDPLAVTGPGAASATLLASVPHGHYRRVLDMGCGSGAIGVHLAGSGATLTASDVNPRALALTELTAALNERVVQTVHSDFADEIDGLFDLVVCNPPFILGRPAGHTTFRDSPDGSGHALLAADLAPLLADGALAMYLTNWEYPIGGAEDPLERLGGELTMLDGCDVLVLERAVVPVEEYVGLWSDDADERQEWVSGFGRRDVAHVGTGIVAVRRTDAQQHSVGLVRDYDTPRARLGRLVADWIATGASQT